MSEIKRYFIYYRMQPDEIMPEEDACLRDDSKWCKHTDVAALEARHAKLLDVAEQMAEALKNVEGHCHGCTHNESCNLCVTKARAVYALSAYREATK